MPVSPVATEEIFVGNISIDAATLVSKSIATEEIFIGSMGLLAPQSFVPIATEEIFVGNVAWVPPTSNAFTSESIFIGNVQWNPSELASKAAATEEIFTNPTTATPLGSLTAYVLFPISEDPSQRPIARY